MHFKDVAQALLTLKGWKVFSRTIYHHSKGERAENQVNIRKGSNTLKI